MSDGGKGNHTPSLLGNTLPSAKLTSTSSIQCSAEDMSRRVRRRARAIQSKRRLEPEVTRYRDIVWQKGPDRLLKYRPNELHYYGWIPFLILRNVKATVFSDVYLYVQVGVLLLYVGLLHATGLGLPTQDLEAFVKLSGTSYMGALFNPAMVITFILGLFTTLVINRWAGVRAAYGKIMSGTLDLCLSVSNVIHNEQDWGDVRARRARTELTRLLNLAHVLVLSSADSQNKSFKRAVGARTFVRAVLGWVKGAGDGKVGPEASFLEGRRARDVSYQALVQEGLVNPDEWSLIMRGEEEGMCSYQTVYFWAQSIIYKCKAAEFIIHEQQMLPMLLNKLNSVAEAASQVVTSATSQMPYPYVHLVSFVAHFYLIYCSTWFGCFLHVGFPVSEKYQDNSSDLNITLERPTSKVSGNAWTSIWCYCLVTLAIILFQGLLNMHSLLDNPFGSHCAMFPLRQNVSEAVNSTRAMLKQADKLPISFGDIFRISNSCSGGSQESESGKSWSEPRHAHHTFLHPHNRKGGLAARHHPSSVLGVEDSGSDEETHAPDGGPVPLEEALNNSLREETHAGVTQIEKSWTVDVERAVEPDSSTEGGFTTLNSPQ